jgi:protein-S-isoprenylcysteine O-methyltransferase Ste14
MPCLFLIPLLFGFGCNLASAFTTAFAQRWGPKPGALVSAVLRDVLGIPIWALGFALAAWAPAPNLFAPGLATDLAGWALVAVGGGIIVLALVTLGGRAAWPSVHDTLVNIGLYARVRHPIHGGALLEFAGIGLLRPSLSMALACGLAMLWVFAQTWLEERDLVQRLPAYRAYMRRVPRFVPHWRAKAEDKSDERFS